MIQDLGKTMEKMQEMLAKKTFYKNYKNYKN